MCAKPAWQWTISRILVADSTHKFVSTNLVRHSNSEVGRPALNNCPIVDRCVKLADHATAALLDYPPRPIEYKAVDCISERVAGLKLVLSPLEREPRATYPTRERKQKWHSAS